MASLFTSIGKILNIKFLLIFISIIFYIDLYFILKFDKSFLEHYKEYLNVNEVLLIILFYLVTLNVIIPLLAFTLSLPKPIFRLLIYKINISWIEAIVDFISNNDLEKISMIEKKAIEDNNSVLMKSYELKLERYNELHALYLFSFFILIELCFLQKYSSFSTHLILTAKELLYFEGDKEILNIIFLGLPCLILVLFALRYISSFRETKIFNWLGGVS